MQTFYDISYPLESHQQASIESLVITYDGSTPIEALPTFVNLKHLDLTLNKSLPDDSILGKLLSLESLTLQGSYKSKVNIKHICNLPALTSLCLQDVQMTQNELPKEIGKLSKLTNLKLDKIEIDTLPPEIGQLSALEECYLLSCLLLTNLPDTLYTLPKLHTLCLTELPIQYIPPQIAQLAFLQVLDLRWSGIKELPEELVMMPSLQVAFDSTPAYARMGDNRAKKYQAFMEKLWAGVTDIDKRKTFFNLYGGYHDRVRVQNQPEYVLEAMTFSDSALSLSAVAYWYAEKPSPFPAQQKMVLHLNPAKEFKLDWKEVTPLLEQHNIAISSQFNKDVTHLVVGSRPGAVLERALAMNLPVVSYGHFFDYLRLLDNSVYLNNQDADTQAMAENLLNLLRSDDSSNVDLGLQMALGGGLNDLYLYEIILLYIWAYQQNARFKLVEKILEKHLPIDAFLHLKTVRQQQQYMDENVLSRYLDNIAANRFIEAGKLGKAFFEKFQIGKQYCLSQRTSFLWYCNQYRKNSVLRLNGCEIVKLSDAIGELQGIKILYLHENKLQDLPPSLIHLAQLDTLNLSNNKLTALPAVLTSFPKLASLDISHNKLTELPDEIGKMQALTTLNISGNQISNLPDTIYDLPALRRLEIGKSNPIHKKRKQIQEKIPYCKVE